MHLSPSDIHFLRDYLTDSLTPDETLLTTLSDRFLSANELPKIQVVERNGAWFALNNTSLHVFRALQRQGKCVRIQVDVVPLSKVPKSVQESMVVELSNSEQNVHSATLNRSCSFTNVGLGLELENGGEGICNQVTNSNYVNEGIGAAENAAKSNEGSSGKVTKRGYHKLSDGSKGDCDDAAIRRAHHLDSETEGTSTDYSDYDHEVASGEGEEEESDSEYDESLTCNVCDRSFASTRKLAQHQQRKRHFGCSVCDSIFPNLMTLELHKESLEHWSDDDDDSVRGDARSAGESDDDDDVRSPTEELERLL